MHFEKYLYCHCKLVLGVPDLGFTCSLQVKQELVDDILLPGYQCNEVGKREILSNNDIQMINDIKNKQS